MSSPSLINAHIRTSPSLPSYNLVLPSTTTVSTLYARLATLIPVRNAALRLSTVSGRPLAESTSEPLSAYTADNLLNLRLSIPLCGGKGGFGSQLRAAGGRMSSRKKSQENSDSCRNLDGRRLRTVKEAKALAAYLEVKPEMDRVEKEKRLARWRKIIENAERKDDGEVKKRFDDHEWIEACEEDRERTREAVLRSLREGYTDRAADAAEASASASGSSGAGSDASEGEEVDASKPAKKTVPKLAGWDDDEFMSSDDDEEMEDIQEEDEEEEDEPAGKGKGKAAT